MPPWNAAGTRVSSASRHRSRQRQRQMPGRAQRVARRIEPLLRPAAATAARCIPLQNESSCATLCVPRMRRKPLRPAPERRPPRRQRNRLPRRDRLPRRRQVRHQDPPRHPVDRKMMDRKPQPPGTLRPGIEPHRLHHHAGRRISRRSAASASAAISSAQRPASSTPADIDPPQAGPAATAPGGAISSRHSPSAARRIKPQPQRVVMIEHRLQAPPSDAPAQPRRHPQQHRLAEPVERPAALLEPAHDRRRRQAADRKPRHDRPRHSADAAGSATTPAAAASASTV